MLENLVHKDFFKARHLDLSSEAHLKVSSQETRDADKVINVALTFDECFNNSDRL